MARFRKTSSFTIFLLAIIALQFAGLLGLLLSDTEPSTSSEPDVDSLSDADNSDMPDWLRPAEAPAEKEPPADALTAREILSENQVIAHGMGVLDGITTLNCLEAFQQQYERGVRVFEVDLRLTSDMQAVLRHDWRAGWQAGISETAIPSLEAFLNRPILEQYTPLSFRDLLLLMEEYPDICIITDTKFTEAEIVTLQFEAMLSDAHDLGLTYLFDRIVIQVYSELMYTVVDGLHHFPNYLYTLYAEGFGRTEAAFRDIASFCKENSFLGITLWDYWWDGDYAPIAKEYGLSVFAHTVNDAGEALALLDSGISAVYTDSLTPASLTEAESSSERK